MEERERIVQMWTVITDMPRTVAQGKGASDMGSICHVGNKLGRE